MDIILTKDSLLLNAILSPLFFSGFNNPYKKIRNKENRQKLESEKTRVYAQKPFKNSISGQTFTSDTT